MLLLQVLLFVLQAVVRSRRRRSRFFSCVPLFWQFSTFPQSPQQQQQQISHAAMQFIIKIIVSCSQLDGPGGGAWQGRRCLPKKKCSQMKISFSKSPRPRLVCVCLNKMKVFARQSLTHIEGSLPVSHSVSQPVYQSISQSYSQSVGQSDVAADFV